MTGSVDRRRLLSVTMLVIVAASGCFPPFRRKAPAPPTVQLRLDGSADLNRGRDSTAHSVVVTVYQLSARARFDAATAAALLRNDAQALGDELVQKHQVTLEPSSQQTMTVTLAGPTKFLAATADFFIRDGDAWRQVSPVSTGKKKQVTIDVRGRQLRLR